ncbi:MAG: hypothetical protein FVQ80_09915 [Planctomycetes bacterium]|nr:hypothetical protein [Planctomycetota bacterium]
MNAKKLITAVFIVTLLLANFSLAADYYVDPDGNDLDAGTSWATAFATIQAGINAASGSNIIDVNLGTYYETIDFNGKAITLQSTDPNNWDVVADTIIDGNGAGTVVTLNSGEDANSILSGFTITGGNATNGGGIYCSGTQGNPTSPTINKCIIADNTANSGGGICSNVTYGMLSVNNCIVQNNNASNGGGIYQGYYGGIDLKNSIIHNNQASTGGGGIYRQNYSGITVTNCTITENAASTNGGGINLFGTGGATIKNSIIWNNTAGTSGDEIYGTTTSVTYSDIKGGYSGASNIDSDPCFVNTATDDYHIKGNSPCYNAGASGSYTGQTDIDNQTRLINGTVDIGADEIPDAWYVDADADGANNGSSWRDAFATLQQALDATATNGNIDEIWVANGTYYPDEGTGHTNDDRTEAFELAANIAVYGGFSGNEISRSSRDPATNLTILSGDIDKNATPDSNNSYNVVVGAAGATLDGFTITNGYANHGSTLQYQCGGGMYNNSVSPTVTNCIFDDNHAPAGRGGAMYNNNSDPVITDCAFTDNSCYGGNNYGGGAMWNIYSNPTITDCLFSGNSANSHGGAIHSRYSNPTMIRCIFSDNTAIWGSGGAVTNRFDCLPTIISCSFIDNTANHWGGGMYNNDSDSTIVNCLFIGNSCSRDTNGGGGIFNSSDSDITVTNCTFSGNSTLYYGGAMCNASSSDPIITNCIFWDNTADVDGNEVCNNNASATIAYSDIEGGSDGVHNMGGGTSTLTNIISSNPNFVDAGNDNYHIDSDSTAVIDAGDNSAISETTDLDGNDRTVNGDSSGGAEVDMGCYEYQG